jgi:hypothetical protein
MKRPILAKGTITAYFYNNIIGLTWIDWNAGPFAFEKIAQLIMPPSCFLLKKFLKA